MFREPIDEPFAVTEPFDHDNAVLTPGTIINNGASIVTCLQTGTRVPGDTYASWRAVCVRPGKNYHHYAVWTVVARPDGWHAESGEYFHDLDKAIAALHSVSRP